MQFRNSFRHLAAAAILGAAVVAPAQAQMDHSKMGKDIVATAVAAGSFKTLATLLTEADLVKTLQGAGPFTVFAPTDAAFAAIPAAAVAKLRADKGALTKVLTYHVIAGKITAADLAKMADKDGYITAKTVSGVTLKLHLAGKAVHVNVDKGDKAIANVTTADVMASNGVIHVIDKVLMP